MNDVWLRIVLYVILMCQIEASPLFGIFDYNPGKFAHQRYQQSRNKTISRLFNPLTSDVLDFMGLANNFGYAAEEHYLTTIDGYQLRIHRIPGTLKNPKAEGKPIVYFQHGLFASSDTWILMGPTKDLAYMMANEGYDVWLGNARGNTYSRSHVWLSPDYDSEFWQFSFHEIALFDVSTTIDYILELTNQTSLMYIGHSMGTTISYVLLSIKPEYNEKINLVISLAPVALWHAPPRPFMRFLRDNSIALKNFLISTRINEIFPLTAINSLFARRACSDGSALQPICLGMVFYFSGYDPDQLNTTTIPHILSYFPAGASTRTLIHFSQHLITGDFRLFDYGITQNFAIYKQKQPPLYNLSNIIAPVALLYGKGDVIVQPQNVEELSRKLPNVVMAEPVKHELFSHLDFLYSRNIKELVNDRVIDVMKKVLKRNNV